MQCLAKQICPRLVLNLALLGMGLGEVYYVNVAHKRGGVGGRGGGGGGGRYGTRPGTPHTELERDQQK